jgi:hypothetical protein
MARAGASIAVGAALLAAAVTVGSAAQPARAALGPVTLEFTGAPQLYDVPAGVTQLQVDMFGAQGGIYDVSNCATGGFGGRTQATIAVTAGETLVVHVGGAGATYDGTWPDSGAGGYNGGGDGRVDSVAGSRGGGGASDVRRAPYGLDNRLVVAGGGGGSGNLAGAAGSGGAGGGNIGGSGAPAPNGGGGGTQEAGGAAGTTDAPVFAFATAGSAGQGGDGGYSAGTGAYTGGGGGGGWYGGGGAGGSDSSPGAGGGGGSSYGPAGSTFAQGVRGVSGACDEPLHGVVTITPVAPAPPPAPSTGTYVALAPARLLDTRLGVGTGGAVGKVSAGGTIALLVAGHGGVPPSGADAVLLNVTSADPDAAGYAAIYPCGQPPPDASNLNFGVGETVPNAVVVKLGTGGNVCLFTDTATHLIVDVSGYFLGAGQAPAARYNPLPPRRIADTRVGAKLEPGEILQIPVLGREGVPPAGVSAVAFNLTATEGDAGGYLSAFPCAQLPESSNVNFVPGASVATLVISKMGLNGAVCVLASARVHVVADVSGWFGADGASTGGRLTSMPPQRILDTRAGVGAAPGPVLAGGTLGFEVLGRAGVPAAGVEAVVLNLTVTQASRDGYVAAYPCGEDVPNASNVNHVGGRDRANLVMVKVGAGGQVCVYSDAAVHLVADVSGWFGTSGQ